MPEISDIPFAGRFTAKLEAIAIADLGDRLPEGPGDALLIFDGAIPYIYLSNAAGTAWLKFALIDVTSGEPADNTVLTWDAAANKAGFEASSGGALLTLSDVDATPPPDDGDSPIWDDGSSKFIFGPAGATVTLLGLSDVDASPAPTDNQVMTWRASDSKGVFMTPAAPALTYARVQKTGLVSVTSGGSYTVTWDVEDLDTIGGFALGTDATLFTAPQTGVYQVTFTINGYAATPEARITVMIVVNGSTIYYFYGLAPVDLPITTIHGSRLIGLTATDEITIVVNPSGSNFDLTAGECYLEVVRLS